MTGLVHGGASNPLPFSEGERAGFCGDCGRVASVRKLGCARVSFRPAPRHEISAKENFACVFAP